MCFLFCKCKKYKLNLNILDKKIIDYDLSYHELIQIQKILETKDLKEIKDTRKKINKINSNYF
tara:strand:- start:1040 stop:1228 length:189 start_codon:yes stop_codon:yes gene_type:complete